MAAELNIATMALSEKVQRYMMAEFYKIQLETIQAEAAKYGCYFALSETGIEITPAIEEHFSLALECCKQHYLRPLEKNWQAKINISDGYNQRHFQSIITALAALGIRLQAGPMAHIYLVALENEYQRFSDAGVTLCPVKTIPTADFSTPTIDYTNQMPDIEAFLAQMKNEALINKEQNNDLSM
jgi:hypothetical protein